MGNGERTRIPGGATYLRLCRGARGGHLSDRKSGQESGVAARKGASSKAYAAAEDEARRRRGLQAGYGQVLPRSPSGHDPSSMSDALLGRPLTPNALPCLVTQAFQAALEPPPGCLLLLLSAKELYDRPPGPEGVTQNPPGTPPNYNSRQAQRERPGSVSAGNGYRTTFPGVQRAREHW